jgi:ABC-type multidrug transport system ATPase subunit
MADEPSTQPEIPSARSDRPVKKKANVREGAPPAIELRNVVRKFGSATAVNDVSFSVPDGAVYGLIGPNGAGKTTTFSMIAGFLAPTSGELFVLDHKPESVEALKGRLGVLPQDALLPANERVGDFLVYLGRLQGMTSSDARASAEGVLAEVDGASWWKTKCGTLSHGMAKRVGIAQALLGKPRVILLDEPTAGLDPRVAFHIRQLVKTRKGRATIVISSHNLQELEEICDGAAVLDRGQLVASGTMSELTASAEEVRFNLARGPVPEEAVRGLPGVKLVSWDKSTRELTVSFERSAGEAEDIIALVVPVLLAEKARLSGISKGRGLEQRVMELTD